MKSSPPLKRHSVYNCFHAMICQFVSAQSLSTVGHLMGALPCLSSQEPPGAKMSSALPCADRDHLTPTLTAHFTGLYCNVHLDSQAYTNEPLLVGQTDCDHCMPNTRAQTHTPPHHAGSRCPALAVLKQNSQHSEQSFIYRTNLGAHFSRLECGRSYLYGGESVSYITQKPPAYSSFYTTLNLNPWENIFIYWPAR